MSEMSTDVRALLRDFCASKGSEFYFRANDWEVFFARGGGTTNPMRAGPETASAIAVPVVPVETVCAQHLGLLEPVAAEGAQVEAGSVVARLRVLDRFTDLVASRPGTVHFVKSGPLVEFGEACLEIA